MNKCWFKPPPVAEPAPHDEAHRELLLYSNIVLNTLGVMKFEGCLTDVLFEVGAEAFHAHQNVLAAISPYFRSLFTALDRQAGTHVFRLTDIRPQVMSLLLSAVYGNMIDITYETVYELLAAAKHFQVERVVDQCCSYIAQVLSPDNAIQLVRFATSSDYVPLIKQARDFITSHFLQVSKRESFLRLTRSELGILIDADDLNVNDESEVYEAVVAWVRADERCRCSVMPELILKVRCKLLAPRYLKNQIESEFMGALPLCRDYLRGMVVHLEQHQKVDQVPRKPNTPRFIYVAGGRNVTSVDDVEAYSIDEGTWRKLPKLTGGRANVGGVSLKGSFYVVCGEHWNSGMVEKYDPAKAEWKLCCEMLVARRCPGVTTLDGFIYVIGGISAVDCYNIVERYDPETGAWMLVSPMSVKREALAVAVANRYIYAIGGSDGHYALSTVERYRPETDEWSTMAPLITRRRGAAAAAVGNFIYVAGGRDGDVTLDRVERYNTWRNSWKVVAPMLTPRSDFTLTAVGGLLYAVGGCDNFKTLNTVEVYDPLENAWERGVPMALHRSSHAAALVNQQCIVHS